MPRINRPQNKNALKHSRDDTMSRNPAITKDQFGSRHHDDDVKATQRQRGRPSANDQDTSFRESAQDTRKQRGAKNRQPGSRRTQKHSSPARKAKAKR